MSDRIRAHSRNVELLNFSPKLFSLKITDNLLSYETPSALKEQYLLL